MGRSEIKSIITLSSSDFFQKIIKKYQTGKRRTLRLPMMIFYESRGGVLPKKISPNIQLHLHVANQNIVRCLTVKTIPAMKGMTSWLNTENALQSIIMSKNVQNINYEKQIFVESLNIPKVYQFTSRLFPIELLSTNKILIVPFLKSSYFKAGNITTQSNKILKLLPLSVNSAFHRRLTRSTSSDGISIVSVLNSLFFKNENIITELNIRQNPMFPDVNSLKSLKFPYRPQFSSRNSPTGYIYANRILIVSLLKSLFIGAGRIKTESNNMLNSLISTVNPVFSWQPTQSISSEFSLVNPQVLNYHNYMRIINYQRFGVRNNFESVNTAVYPTIIEKESKFNSHFQFERKSPLILSRGNSLFNSTILSVNRLFFENSNQAIINKPLIKYYNRSSGDSESIFFQRKDGFKTGGESLYLHDQRHIEREIESIKQIMIQTKESVLDKPKPSLGEADVKRYLDINRISSEVYRNIERTIRMERERRGI